MKKIYVANGVNDRYSVSETKIEHLDGKTFDSYSNLLSYFKSEDKEIRRMKTRDFEIVAVGMSSEKMRKLEKDILEAGFKNFRGVNKE